MIKIIFLSVVLNPKLDGGPKWSQTVMVGDKTTKTEQHRNKGLFWPNELYHSFQYHNAVHYGITNPLGLNKYRPFSQRNYSWEFAKTKTGDWAILSISIGTLPVIVHIIAPPIRCTLNALF